MGCHYLRPELFLLQSSQLAWTAVSGIYYLWYLLLIYMSQSHPSLQICSSLFTVQRMYTYLCLGNPLIFLRSSTPMVKVRLETILIYIKGL